MKAKKILLGLLALSLGGCASESQIKSVLEKNPDILFNAIEKNPEKFFEVLQRAQMSAQRKQQEDQEKEEKERVETELKNPLKPEWSADRASEGNPQGDIKIVEYSDFQCPYCGRGYRTLQQVMKAYPGRVHFLFKNLPLPMHPMAMPAAKRFEAIALQDPKKAYAYHNMVFENQDKLNAQGEKFLDEAAKKAGANMARLKKDIDGDKVKERIEADMKEAEKYGFQGTPAFVVNGVSIRGAYPFEMFKPILERTLEKK